MRMASLQGLPPLPKSLSGLLNFSSAQWREFERLHAMRTLIQQDLNRASPIHHQMVLESRADHRTEVSSSSSQQGQEPRTRTNRLDAQLALLRKEMVGLRQLDMSLLCQLWSLNESIQEYKQVLQERLSTSQTSSPGWDNGLDSPVNEELPELNGRTFEFQRPPPPKHHRGLPSHHHNLTSVPEKNTPESSSCSSLEYADML